MLHGANGNICNTLITNGIIQYKDATDFLSTF
jgi:hypothetical protein